MTRARTPLLALVACLVLALTSNSSAVATPGWLPILGRDHPEVPSERIAPSGVSAGYVVLDASTGRILAQRHEHRQFRSASVVKVLIALDYLMRRGTDPQVPPEDRALLSRMLRPSANDPASKLWVRGGFGDVIRRLVADLGLQDTRPPARPGLWGFTPTSAADIATVYRYLLTKAPDAHRRIIMGHLREAARCATSGQDQYFGIPRATTRPFAIKQGWSGLSSGADQQRCRSARATQPRRAYRSAVMHTTGIVGADDETIVVLLTRHTAGTPYPEAARMVTKMADALI